MNNSSFLINFFNFSICNQLQSFIIRSYFYVKQMDHFTVNICFLRSFSNIWVVFFFPNHFFISNFLFFSYLQCFYFILLANNGSILVYGAVLTRAILVGVFGEKISLFNSSDGKLVLTRLQARGPILGKRNHYRFPNG